MPSSPTSSLAQPLYTKTHHVPTPITFLNAKPRQTLLADLEKVFGRKLRLGARVTCTAPAPAKTISAPLILSTPSAPSSPPPPYSTSAAPPLSRSQSAPTPPPTYNSTVQISHREREAKQERTAQRTFRTIGEDVTKLYGIRVDRWDGNWV